MSNLRNTVTGGHQVAENLGMPPEAAHIRIIILVRGFHLSLEPEESRGCGKLDAADLGYAVFSG